jgi:hypothetical protein
VFRRVLSTVADSPVATGSLCHPWVIDKQQPGSMIFAARRKAKVTLLSRCSAISITEHHRVLTGAVGDDECLGHYCGKEVVR